MFTLVRKGNGSLGVSCLADETVAESEMGAKLAYGLWLRKFTLAPAAYSEVLIDGQSEGMEVTVNLWQVPDW